MRELPRLTLSYGRVLCADCADEATQANRPADVVDVMANLAREFSRADDGSFPIDHIEPTHARLVAAQYQCDACDATGKQAIEPGGPLYDEVAR